MSQRGSPGLTDEQVARVLDALERLIADEGVSGGSHGALARVARRLGVTGAALSQIRARSDGKPAKHRPSHATAAIIARDPSPLIASPIGP